MDRLEGFDLGMLYWFGSWHRPWVDHLAIVLTHLGDPVVRHGVAVLGAGLLVLRRRPRSALALLLVSVLSWGLEWGTKRAVGRVRPDVVWALVPVPDEPGFPSGHALGSMAIYGSLGLLGRRLVVRPWLRVAPLLAGVALAVLIGLTRPYLGVHYPLDVLAGWTGGLLCVGLAQALSETEEQLNPPS